MRSGHGTTQECYGYATVRSIAHPSVDTWCPSTTISLSAIPSAFFDIYSANLPTIQSEVDPNDLIGWSNHAAYVKSADWNPYVYPNRWEIDLAEKETQSGPINTSIDLNDVIDRLNADPDKYAKKKSGLYRQITYTSRYNNGSRC